MSLKIRKLENLLGVKKALAAKYTDLKDRTNSTPRRKHFQYKANRYTRQVAAIESKLEAAKAK
ncbi:hypothetical protein [Stratiformator vulcanicus]|uniref:Uncharacterized protein n=1 Tax=Stratiformator vulcanicus TaxID=2527980 RepID=A0A517R065_9PLAN|nr:hypothetical protein [Stratiformator vulcanicus]QDT37214.1 hypothetical protein Pan189_15860 [Stratiformator vulcanicus]